MSKNTTRRALALGSAVALGASAFVASPAYAVVDVSLTPYWGAGNANELVAVTKVDNGFVLSTELADIGSATASNLKYMIEILNDNTDYENVNAGTGDNDANFNNSNRIEFYSKIASRLTTTSDDLTDHAATEATVVANDNKVVVSPVYKDATMAVSALTVSGATATAGSPASTSITLAMTVADGHGIVVGDVVTLGGTATADSVDITGDVTVTSVGDTTVTGTITKTVDVDANGSASLTSATLVVKGSITAAVGQNHLLYIEVPAFDDYDADTTADDTLSIRVTAWIDETSDNAIGNEYKSESVDITFAPTKAVEVTGSFDYAELGQTGEVSGQFTVNANNQNWFNVLSEQDAAPNVDFTGAALDATEANVASTYNSVLDQIEFLSTSAVTGLNAGEMVATVQQGAVNLTGATTPYFTGATDESEIKYTVGSNSVDELDLALSVSDSASNETASGTDLLSASTTEVIAGTKSLPFVVTVWDDKSTKTAVAAGINVLVTLSDVGGDLGTTTLTTESKTLKSTGVDSVSFTKKTDANGQIKFTVAADKAVAGESFTVNAVAEGRGLLGGTTTAQTIAFEDEDFTLLQMPSDINFTVAPEGSISVDYKVVNQFGKAPVGNFQLAVTRGTPTGDRADDVADQANWSYVVPVSSTGRATVAITDNGSATVEGGDTVTVTLQEAATAGGGYIGTSDSDTFTLTYETDWSGLTVDAKVNNNGSAVGTTAVYPVAVEPDTLVDYDGRVDITVPTYDADNTFDDKANTTADQLLRVYGTVVDSDNDGVTGVTVRISAAGMNFASADSLTRGSSLRLLNDSITVTTDASGVYQAWVRSSVGGSQTISVDAQGATATVAVVFAASTGAAAAMDLDVASSVVDGRTADVKVTITDKLGNPVSGVAVNFKESGPGYLNTTSGTTDGFGEVIVNLITVAGDTGTANITASATVDGIATAISKSITIGTEQKVNAGSFKGYVALYAKGYAGQRMSAKVGKDWVVVPALASNFERVVEFTGAGVDVAVRIYIDRVLMDTINLTTK